jgi:ubiquinone/menaquinone biosynthesis C-methylase UbiE
MGCHGGFSLDEATRRSWYNPEAVLASLESGMTFVDVGCGDGFFTLLAAKKVGVNGRVYAVDIDASNVAKLQNKADAEKLTNIVVVVGRAEDTVFCQECADIVFYSMDLHDFDDPAKVLENARLMVKPWGKVIDLDWKKTKMDFGPPVEIRLSEQQVADMLQTAGFCSDVHEAGPYHYVVTAKPKHTL